MILVTGGSGSGKSAYAERYAAALPTRPLYYIATMALFDAESVRRAERHRAQRAKYGFVTLERDRDLAGIEGIGGGCALLECVTTLLSNELYYAPEGAMARVLDGIETLLSRVEALVVVTGELNADGIRYEGETADYLRALGGINRRLGARADRVIEVVSGIPVARKG